MEGALLAFLLHVVMCLCHPLRASGAGLFRLFSPLFLCAAAERMEASRRQSCRARHWVVCTPGAQGCLCCSLSGVRRAVCTPVAAVFALTPRMLSPSTTHLSSSPSSLSPLAHPTLHHPFLSAPRFCTCRSPSTLAALRWTAADFGNEEHQEVSETGSTLFFVSHSFSFPSSFSTPAPKVWVMRCNRQFAFIFTDLFQSSHAWFPIYFPAYWL